MGCAAFDHDYDGSHAMNDDEANVDKTVNFIFCFIYLFLGFVVRQNIFDTLIFSLAS